MVRLKLLPFQVFEPLLNLLGVGIEALKSLDKVRMKFRYIDVDVLVYQDVSEATQPFQSLVQFVESTFFSMSERRESS